MSKHALRVSARAFPHAESIILSAGGAESIILSACAESIILSAGGAESMILSVRAESIILSAGGTEQWAMTAMQWAVGQCNCYGTIDSTIGSG